MHAAAAATEAEAASRLQVRRRRLAGILRKKRRCNFSFDLTFKYAEVEVLTCARRRKLKTEAQPLSVGIISNSIICQYSTRSKR